MPAADSTVLKAYLDALRTSPQAKATAWDAVAHADDPQTFKAELDTLPFSPAVKADLWNIGAGQSVKPINVERAPLKAESPTWAQAGGYGPRGSFMADMAEGATAGLASTVFHGGDLIRRATGMTRVIDTPEARQAMKAPGSIPGKVGYYGEQGAEFALPLAEVSKGVKGAGLLTRMAAEGAASGTVAGVQSGGDPTTTAIATVGGAALPAVAAGGSAAWNAAKRAAAGASEDGIGGAIAGVVRASSPVEAKTALIQALKPRSVKRGFAQALDRAVPEIKAAEADLGKPIEGIDDLLKATDIAKKKIRAQYDAYAGPQRAMGAGVDLSPVADAMEASIPKKVQLESPGQAQAITDRAALYRRRVPIEEAEQYLKETNAELDAYYAKYPAAQRKALLANPETAQLEAQARTLRDAIYGTLDAGTGDAPRELQRRYGALMDIEQEAHRRANVAARQQPESLSEQIGKTRAAVDYAKGGWRLMHGDLSGAADIAGAHAGRATATFLKEQQTTDALIRRAFAGFEGAPVPVPAPVQRPVRGFLDAGAHRMPPPVDPSFVRGVPADVAINGRPRQLPAGVTQLPSGPDQSFVRGVRAQPAISGTPRQLGPARTVREMPGTVTPDPSGGGSVPAAPIRHDIDPFLPVKKGGIRVGQYSGDPSAQPMPAWNDPEVHAMLTNMARDLEEYRPQQGRIVRDSLDTSDNHYAPGTPGSRVADDVRVISEQHVSNGVIARALHDLLNGKPPTNRLHTALLDAAQGYLEKRPGYQRPGDWAAHDAGWEAFSRGVDEIGRGGDGR